jgi:predicted secreted protein with PEFG-CTERM motif
MSRLGVFFGVAALVMLVIMYQPNNASSMSGMSGVQGMMTGTNVNLMITPSPYNPATDSNVTLAFIPNSSVPTLVTGGVIKHLDYNITVSEGGNNVFNQKFHTHNGNLTLVFTPSSGQISVTGGNSDAAQTTTGSFYVSGPVFNNSGSYGITADVIGVNFSPIIPLEDKFTVQAVPEFGDLVSIILVIAITSTIIIAAKARVIQKL